MNQTRKTVRNFLLLCCSFAPCSNSLRAWVLGTPHNTLEADARHSFAELLFPPAPGLIDHLDCEETEEWSSLATSGPPVPPVLEGVPALHLNLDLGPELQKAASRGVKMHI